MLTSLADTLGHATLARAAACVAARTDDADAAILACAPLLARALPVARVAMLTLAEIGLDEGPLGRRARAILEDGLVAALRDANELGASGTLAAELEPQLGELLLPGFAQRTAVATLRVVELVATLVALAPQRAGLTERISALAREVPPFLGQPYVIAFVTALGEPTSGPYLAEVRERLERAAQDLEPGVHVPALAALGLVARDTPHLQALLAEELESGDAQVRTAAALALADVGDVSDEAAAELADLVELGEPEEALAAVRALVACHREVPDALLETLADPLVAAAAHLLVAPTDEHVLALLAVLAARDGDDSFDLRVAPVSLLANVFRTMPTARAAAWIARFATGEVAALGETLVRAYVGDVDPAITAAAEPVIAALAAAQGEHAGLLAMVAARLAPRDPRLEPLILARTTVPALLIALASLSEVTAAAHDVLLAGLEEPDHAELAITALARCDLAAALAPRLLAHLSDDDPLAESAHATLLAWIDRGVI